MVLLTSPKCSLWWPRYLVPRPVSKSSASHCTDCSAGETESFSTALKNDIPTFDLQVHVSEVHAGVQTKALNNASGHVIDTTADGACSIHAVFGSCTVSNDKLHCECPRKVIRSAFHKSLSTIRAELSSNAATTTALEHIEISIWDDLTEPSLRAEHERTEQTLEQQIFAAHFLTDPAMTSCVTKCREHFNARKEATEAQKN